MMDKPRLIPEYYKVWLLLFVFFQSSLAYSASSVGEVLFVHGTVHSIDQQGSQRLLSRGDGIFAGDKIVTQPASSAQILMVDDGYFAIRPSSEVSIDEYRFEKKATDSVKASILKGGLRSITGTIGKKHKRNFSLKTPVATIGIRGTDMVIFYILPELASPELGEAGSYVSVNNGAGFIQTNVGELLVEKGKAAYAATLNTKPISILELPGIFRKETFEKLLSEHKGRSDLSSDSGLRELNSRLIQQQAIGLDSSGQAAADVVKASGSAAPSVPSSVVATTSAATSAGVGAAEVVGAAAATVAVVATSDGGEDDEQAMAQAEKTEQDNTLSTSVFISAGGGTDTFMNGNIDPVQTSMPRFAPMYRVMDLEGEDETYASLAAGFDAHADLGSTLDLYLKAAYQYRHPVDLEDQDTGIYDATVGAAFYHEELLRIWLEANRISASGDMQWREYDSNRVALGAEINLGTLVGLFAEASKSDLNYVSALNHASDYSMLTSHEIDMATLEAGVRLNPVLIPLDIYLSALVGEVTETNDSQGSRIEYDAQDMFGLKARAEFNQDGFISLFGAVEAIRLEDAAVSDLEDDLVELKLGGELKLTDNLSVSGAVKRIYYWDKTTESGFDSVENSVVNINDEESSKSTITEFKVKLAF